MGNTPSSPNTTPEKEFENFYDVVDYVATYYILTMDFKSLSKLSEKEYCDKLIILTADILEKYLNEQHITYLEQRVKDGVEVNTLNKERFLFVDRDVFDNLDISHDTKLGIKKNIKKQRVCIGIAKFYVKVAHIFAAILMTINPVYAYTDAATGLTMKTSLLDKDKIPKGISKKVLKLNVCDNRIDTLRNKEVLDEESGKATLQPDICEANIGDNGMDKSLADEPGIPELMQLYFDKYDDKTGTFTGMTEETEKLFLKDLQKFYTAFTGNDTMPPEVTRFSDIKLRDYNKQEKCVGPDPKFRSRVRISQKDDLFLAYAENMKNMIKTAADNQIKLLDVINELFTYTIDPKTQQRIIRVNPDLTEETLKAAVEKTRKYIMELYVKCETDYENGVKIYDAIVESKNAEILPRQIEVLSEESDRLVESARPLGEAPAFVMAQGSLGEKPFEPLGLGPEGLGPEGLKPEVLGPEGLGPEGLGPEGLGPEGLRPEGEKPLELNLDPSLQPPNFGDIPQQPPNLQPPNLQPPNSQPSNLQPPNFSDIPQQPPNFEDIPQQPLLEKNMISPLPQINVPLKNSATQSAGKDKKRRLTRKNKKTKK